MVRMPTIFVGVFLADIDAAARDARMITWWHGAGTVVVPTNAGQQLQVARHAPALQMCNAKAG